MLRTAILTALLLLGPAWAAGAQQEPARDTLRRAAVVQPDADSARLRGRVSPRGAFLRSLVLPGWGQSVVGAPERGAVYFALEAGSLWMVYKSQQKLEEAVAQERIQRAAGQLQPGRRSALVRERRAQREDWITLSVFWLFFSGADAFVAAYLRDFDEHVGVSPRPGGATQLQYSVPVGPRR